MDLKIPVVGINTGRLGFLATIQPNDLNEALQKIVDSDFKISERTLITVSTSCNHTKIENNSFAFNEIAVSRKNTTSMININTQLNDEFLNSYWADGLIVSTPTGSTAYSLSVGGPLLLQGSDSFILSPIAPHNLTVRPLVFPDHMSLSLKIDGRGGNIMVSLDSRSVVMESGFELVISKAPYQIRTLRLRDHYFYK